MTNRRAGPTKCEECGNSAVSKRSSRSSRNEVNIDSGKHWTSSLGMLVNVMEGAGTCERGGAQASILRTKITNLSDPSTSWYKFFF
ncbi:hypothetical protein J6590_101951 [Homalodisca vitripennis]|nr:hypothetical protein J6590_101951 [Homalodisca vitripennis]